MKTTRNLLLAGIMTAFCCSIGNAQISYTNALSLNGATLIYSNLFNGPAVTVDGTAPTVANNVLGGTNNATWNCVSNGADAYLYQDGTIGITGDSYLLPFTPQSGYVYILTVSANLPVMASGKWINWGFAQYATNKSTGPRFADTAVNGYDFMIGTCVAGSEQYWAGPRATGYNFASQLMPTAGNHVLQIILDTTGTKWIGTAFVDGKQLGTNYTYSSNPPIGAAGMGQTILGSSTGIQYIYFTLSAMPIVIGQQPVSANIDAGAAFTNTVVVAGSGPLFYQWYDNDTLLAGATNASLIFNPASPGNAGTNYYVVVTNSFGSVTSAVASLTVYTNPVLSAAYPVAYTNPITLFGGTNVDGTNYIGSSPTFSVSALGGLPLAYQWLTNGVAVGGAVSASFTFTNCQMNSPTNFVCIVSNSYGEATNTWSLSYAQAPTAPYPQAVLALQSVGFWRLNETPDDGNGNVGTICHDYQSGNNGFYTNVYLNDPGYTSTDPTVQATYAGALSGADSGAFGVQGIDFAAPANTSVAFSVAAWVDGASSQTANNGIIAKGYGGAEQFVLDVISGKYRFLVRDAAGGLHSAVATIGPDGFTWHHLVGVCDEANSNVLIYVDGVQSGSAAIPPRSGLLSSSQPMSIGARSSSSTANYDWQFQGDIADVAAFNSALSAAQAASLYEAPGNSIPLSFVAPLPPTNVVFLANQTLTIPATLFGTPPISYYWTNLTTGAVMGSGATTTNVPVNLNATLTIPNASTNLSGDQLELVVTNAIDSTNWFTTLFSPPPPVTLDYSNPILYSNYFNGGTWTIAGMPVTAANSLVGGTNTMWTDALGANDTGSMQASGVDASTLGDSWILPFTPHSGYVYTLNASLTFSGNPGSWVGLGFAQRVSTGAPVGYGRYADDGGVGPNGYDFMILTESSGNVQCFTGPHATGQIFSQNGFFTAGAGTHTMQVVLDTTGAQWVMAFYVDGVQATSQTYAANPPIGAVGITQNSLSAPGYVQWNYLSLSQEAPGGVPPYLLDPLPPTSVTLLADTSLSIPVTAFGSAPSGYYWSNTNTAAVLGSGATNNMAPFGANLSVADVPGSWNGNTLSLIVTNAYGTNISLVTLTVTNAVNLNSTNIVVTMTGNNLYLTWPVDHKGYRLQAQTNTIAVGLGTNWVDVSGSTVTNQVIMPINANNGSVFYRLIYP